MKKIKKKILGCICMSPVAAGLSYGVYETVLLGISDPEPMLYTLGGFIVIFGVFGLFVFGLYLIMGF